MGYTLVMCSNDETDDIDFVLEGSADLICDTIVKVDPDWRFLFYVGQPDEDDDDEDLSWNHDVGSIDADQFLLDERGRFAEVDEEFSKRDVYAALFASMCMNKAITSSEYKTAYDAAIDADRWYVAGTYPAYLFCLGMGLLKMAKIVSESGESYTSAQMRVEDLKRDGIASVVYLETDGTYTVQHLDGGGG